jgi:uncharacterized membrane protein
MPATTRSPSPPALPANLSFGERVIYVVVGLGLAAAAARPRPNPVLSIIALAAGSYLAWRGATGRDPIMALVREDDA